MSVINGSLPVNETVVELLKPVLENLDQLFLLVNGIFVLLMQPGFALLECGSVRSKNATNILVKNMLDAFFAGIAFWLVGYALAYGDGNFFLGTTYFAGAGLPNSKLAHWFFQYVFAATAATIVSGSLAERCDTNAYFTYSTIITGFIYPIIAHWVWADEGWLNSNGIHDFAGSGVVHLTGGTCALIGAIFLGPRIGRFDGPEPREIRGHSIPLAITGGMILTVGFLAFNGGSQGSISNEGDGVIVARAVCNTTISGCFGGLVSMILVRAGVLGSPKVISVVHTMNGALLAMVSICAGVDKMAMWGAAVTGSIAGCLYLLLHLTVNKVKIDDPLDAIAVHAGGGLWGMIAAPLLRNENGVFMTWNSESAHCLMWNIIGAISIVAWSGILSAIMFGLLKVLGWLRVDAEIETRGLDLVKHNEPAYPAESWFEEQYQDAVKHKIQHENVKRRTSVTPYDIALPPQMRNAKVKLDAIFSDVENGLENGGFITSEDVKEKPASTKL